jgi:peptidoglycan-N-acetylglucosamine deacetylase
MSASKSGSTRSCRLGLLVIGITIAAACAARPLGGAARLQVWGFTVPWDPNSAASARAHASQLDAVVSGWIQLDSTTGEPYTEFRDTLARAGASGSRLMAIVTNAVGGRFHADVVRRLAADPDALARAASGLARRITSARYHGMVLDLEALGPNDRDVTALVARAFIDSARAHGVSPIAVAVPATDTASFPGRIYVPLADYLLVMLYDQHWSTSAPGSIASPAWVRNSLALRVAEVGPEHIIAALPLYGYRWPPTGPATAITFAEAQRNTSSSGTPLVRDTVTQTLHAANVGAWELWVSDAGLLGALVREVTARGVTRIALWRLGQEDPAIWQALP